MVCEPLERLGTLVVAGLDPPSAVVDRIETAPPQDPVVGGLARVVELTAGVGEPVPAHPSDRLELGGG